MIKEAIEYLANKVQAMNLFEKVYSLVEIVNDADGKSFPAVYNSNGKYQIIHYSFNNGTAYIRKNGVMQLSTIDVESYVGCTIYYRMSMPIKLVVFKKKNKLPIDCSYSEDVLSETILSYLINNTNDARQVLNIKQFNINFNSINSDSANVWDSETQGIEQKDINFDIACVSFDIDLELVVDPSCLTNMCNA